MTHSCHPLTKKKTYIMLGAHIASEYHQITGEDIHLLFLLITLENIHISQIKLQTLNTQLLSILSGMALKKPKQTRLSDLVYYKRNLMAFQLTCH